MSFTKTRNVELSVVQHIETAVANNWTGIAVVRAFASAYAKPLPVISVRMLSVDSSRYEIGTSEIRQKYSFIIDIFAKSDGQRMDLADFITNTIKDGFVYNEYSKNSGDNETLVATPNGRIIFWTHDSNSRIDFNNSSDEHDKFRHAITFTVEKPN